jgi:hypothetical protein
MNDDERFNLICSPSLKRIEEKLDSLHHTVAVSNGKPSVLARLDVLEKTPPATEAKPARMLKIGPLELNGYGLNDIVRAAVVVGVLWIAVTSYMGQAKTAQMLEGIKAMKAATDIAAGTP